MIKFIKQFFCKHSRLQELRAGYGQMSTIRISSCQRCGKEFTSLADSDLLKQFLENIRLCRNIDGKINND